VIESQEKGVVPVVILVVGHSGVVADMDPMLRNADSNAFEKAPCNVNRADVKIDPADSGICKYSQHALFGGFVGHEVVLLKIVLLLCCGPLIGSA
jgi:hypothetical protein